MGDQEEAMVGPPMATGVELHLPPAHRLKLKVIQGRTRYQALSTL